MALLVTLPTSARAQAELQEWLNPTLGKLTPRADYRFTYYPDQRVEGQRSDLRVIEHSFSLNTPIAQDDRNEWALSGDARYQDLHNRAILPDTRQRFPDELWDVTFGGNYRHKFENGWIGAGGVTVGSAGDQPFQRRRDVFLRVLAMLRVPQGERNAVLFSLIYASDNEFVGGIPVPGLAYQYVPSDRFNAVIGAPFSSVEYRPIDPLTLEAQYFPLRRVRTRATYQLFRPLRLFAGYDVDNDRYYLAARTFDRDRLFYYEQRLMAGVRFDLRHVGFQVRGGWAFDRFYFQGDDYSDRRHNRVNVDPGPFVAAGASVRF